MEAVMSSRVLRVLVSLSLSLSLSLVALVGCQGDPIEGDPHPLTVGGTLPAGVAAGSMRAEGEGWGDDPFVVLASGVPTGGDAFSLSLPSAPPPEVLWDAADLDALLCAGLDPSGVTTSRSPLAVAVIDRLWRVGPDLLAPLTAASRPGIGFELPSAFGVGDVIHRFVYVARSLTVTGSCSFGGGAVVHDLDLALRPGWNALRTEITAMAGGVVQAFETTVAQDADGLDWFEGEPVLAGVRLRRLPASRWHANASWWGYHQSKLVRDGDDVFVALLDNDVALGEPYGMRVLRVDAAGAMAELARLETSRPGHLLLAGEELHAVLFAPNDMATDPSSGGLLSYAVERDGAAPTMAKIAPASNIRFGTTVLPDGDGLAVWSETVGAQLVVRLRRAALGAAISEWPEVAMRPVDTNFQYPYVVSDGERALVAAVENEHEDDGLGNRYQQVLLWQVGVGVPAVLEQVQILDYRGDPLAASRRRLVEVSDLYLDDGGAAHLLLKTYFDPADANRAALVHWVKPDAATAWGAATQLTFACHWARFVTLSVADDPVVACSEYAGLRFVTLDGARSLGVRLPPRLVGAYAFVAAPRGGTAVDEPLTDLLLIAGTASSYPDGPAVLATVERAAVAAELVD
jgi:hypothetical protein